MAETKKTLVNGLVTELDRLKNRIERVRMAGMTGQSPSMDRAAYVILRSLEQTGPERISNVANRFGLDISTISRHVAALEEDGLVERLADPKDGRAQLLGLTVAGHLKHREVQASKVAIANEQLADWSKDDCAKFVELLGRYNAAMEQRYGSPELNAEVVK